MDIEGEVAYEGTGVLPHSVLHHLGLLLRELAITGVDLVIALKRQGVIGIKHGQVCTEPRRQLSGLTQSRLGGVTKIDWRQNVSEQQICHGTPPERTCVAHVKVAAPHVTEGSDVHSGG